MQKLVFAFRHLVGPSNRSGQQSSEPERKLKELFS